MTLKFELGLDFMKVIPHTKFRDPNYRSNGSVVRALTNRHTDKKTDRPGFSLLFEVADKSFKVADRAFHDTCEGGGEL